MRKWAKLTSVLLAVLLVLASLGGSVGPARALDRDARLKVMSAVVQIAWVGVNGSQVYSVGVGSGTIISADGLILTNCHVADPIRYGLSRDQVPDFDYLGVNLTVRSDRPPQPTYLAEVVVADPFLDLAIIRITRGLDQKPIDPAKLKLPYVEMGDSDSTEVGDELNIFGYPGIGGETVTFTKGVVSGFTLDAAIDGRAWIKTDATIAGGNSGGTGVDDRGLLVGVPTRAGAGGGSDYVDCRTLADTNGDGRIDNKDTCIPTGGFINALRPVKLAQPLFEAARLGVNYQGRNNDNNNNNQPVTPGKPRLSYLVFAPGVTAMDQPMSIVSTMPSGSRNLYLFFDYENMANTMTFEMATTINGKAAPDLSLPAAQWGGDERGVWWVGWSDADMPDGTYTLALKVDGEKLAEGQIKVGGAPTTGPVFENIALSLEATADDEPVEPSVLFPAGTKRLLAFFDYRNVPRNTAWGHNWYVDGQQALAKQERWAEGQSGRYVIELTSQRGLSEGAYRVELTINGKPAAVSSFWVTGSRGSGVTFSAPVFAEGIDRQGKPVRPAVRFGSGLPELHVFSDYGGMEDGLSSVVNWYLNDQKVVESPYEWDGGASGSWHAYVQSNSGKLPDGSYRMELTVAGQIVLSGNTTIGTGSGPTPTPTPQPVDGVTIRGTIIDLDTEEPIPGAYFLVLVPGVTWDSFKWADDEVYTAAQTDEDGYYELPTPLARGDCYTFVLVAQNYWTYAEDDVCIPANARDLIDLQMKLEHK